MDGNLFHQMSTFKSECDRKMFTAAPKPPQARVPYYATNWAPAFQGSSSSSLARRISPDNRWQKPSGNSSITSPSIKSTIMSPDR
ncbi:hypothetical protein CEXT_318341 [Caerostris extrusa]|uniref:Uncharacterized protein n=1 Tax=Caerostris extrusa TaxID=172846 RepID=A0AAV4MZL9_CAEEX|nr:hypothetical protein CEXT_318341 [Caerostris extrusa]